MANIREMEKARKIRGYAIIAKGDTIKQLSLDSFLVPSQSTLGDYYNVRKVGGEWNCECPDHISRGVVCKHIYAVEISLALKTKLDQDLLDFEPKIIHSCKYCGGKVVKDGMQGGKQQYECSKCKRKQFLIEGGFRGMRFDPEIIATSLDLYFKGVSIRKIADHMLITNGLAIDSSTVYRWIVKYVKLMSRYVEALIPQLSGKWHVDEMKIKVRNGDKDGYQWLWNVIDRETRFQLVSMVSKTRSVSDARKVFAKAKEIAKAKPATVTTDGLQSYGIAFTKEFYTNKKPRPEWIRSAGIRSARTNNNLVERLNGTVRERNKVQRGWKNQNTPLAEGQRIYYNFLRPHQALNGKTPAEESGIGLPRRSWLELMKESAEDVA